MSIAFAAGKPSSSSSRPSSKPGCTPPESPGHPSSEIAPPRGTGGLPNHQDTHHPRLPHPGALAGFRITSRNYQDTHHPRLLHPGALAGFRITRITRTPIIRDCPTPGRWRASELPGHPSFEIAPPRGTGGVPNYQDTHHPRLLHPGALAGSPAGITESTTPGHWRAFASPAGITRTPIIRDCPTPERWRGSIHSAKIRPPDHTGFQMFEINAMLTRVKDLKGRTQVLRGYL